MLQQSQAQQKVPEERCSWGLQKEQVTGGVLAERLWSTDGSLCVSAPLTAQPGSRGGVERSCQPSAGDGTVLQDGALSNKGE